MAIYYLDGLNLETSTAIFDDSELTICAADGIYSDGINSRELSGCFLLPSIPCVECPIPCGVGLTPPAGETGLYNLTFNTGTTVADVGAIIIYFNPAVIPDGIRVLYDGTYYNAVASPSDGRIQSISGVADAFTILGEPLAVNNCVPTSYIPITYNYFDGFIGSTWSPGVPATKDITIYNGDDQRGGMSEYSTIVIPKTDALINNVSIQVLGPCANTGWNIEVNCPGALPEFASSLNRTGKFDCVPTTETYFFAQHRNDTNTYPIVTNWVFSDLNGLNVLSNGTYVMANNNVITVVSGVVTAIQACT